MRQVTHNDNPSCSHKRARVRVCVCARVCVSKIVFPFAAGSTNFDETHSGARSVIFAPGERDETLPGKKKPPPRGHPEHIILGLYTRAAAPPYGARGDITQKATPISRVLYIHIIRAYAYNIIMRSYTYYI